jgi:alkanesulfonate monooxygenase SsuD/methylene tetrahydromethanopterin reductase-like flavin-dependent oxidoreductase (luciferase family)
MTHWFPLGLDVLKHKTEVLARHCEAIGRDPSTIERTMAAPVLLAATEKDAAAILDRIPPERRPFVTPSTPVQAAEALRPYLDAGFTGFTFNNNVLPTPDAIGLAGELLRLIA